MKYYLFYRENCDFGVTLCDSFNTKKEVEEFMKEQPFWIFERLINGEELTISPDKIVED